LKARYLQSNQIDKKEWDNLVLSSPQGSIFLESGYIDIILRKGWGGVVVHDTEDKLLAIMPLNIKSKLGIQYALQPVFTKFWGIAFAARDFKNTQSKYSWEKKIVTAIANCIPKNLQAFEYNFHPAFDYPMPFYWKNYEIEARYTYLLNCAGLSADEIFNGYSPGLKGSIRTGNKNNLTIINDTSIDSLIQILSQSVESRKIIVDPKYFGTLRGIFDYGKKTGKSFSLTAVTDQGLPIASSIYIKDNKAIYALAHNMLYEHSHLDALSLLVHHAILYCSGSGLSFDFLGSMIEPIEAFNRRYGAKPVPYLSISKKNILISALGK